MAPVTSPSDEVRRPSPLLAFPGAVPAAADGPDAGIAWHYGDPMGEQRAAETFGVLLDGWNEDHLTVTGPDRLSWLHTLSSQDLSQLADGAATQALWLSPHGQVEHEARVEHLDGVVHLRTEPGHGAQLLEFLRSMVFWSKVELADRTDSVARLRLTGPRARDIVGAACGVAFGDALLVVPPEPGHVVAIPGDPATDAPDPGLRSYVCADRDSFDIVAHRLRIPALAAALRTAGAALAGSWAAAALRIPAHRPRFGVDLDERTIPNELPWLDSAVHLHKGCYRGQETVARVNNLGLPPRRLVMLHLDGTADTMPSAGDAVLTAQGRSVGRIGTVAQHWEYGPIALALVKRTVQPGTPLLAGGVDAAIDPDDAADDGARPTSVDRPALPDLRRR
jgi:folate-binding protein YgfZ